MSNDNPFNILNQEAHSKELSPDSVSGELTERIEKIIKSDDIVLFMKGNEQMPQCGFSANTVAILKHINVKFTTFNILEDMDIRSGLKEYSNWPTFPQLYFKGKLIGGNDIITEMYDSGDLESTLKS
tara:strand:+ start:103014 stop:103394 length:381 start_codon:yes stop_codon:yes gene_type:complete